MSTSTANNANLPQTNPEEIDSMVRSALGAGDTGSTQAIQNLTLIQKARVSRLQRNAATLKKQTGAAKAAIHAAEASVKAGTARAAAMAAVHLQAATPSPQVSAAGWALHGRVFNTQLQPASNFTVFLVDDTKTFQSQFGFSYTDNSGYFLLNYQGPSGAIPASGQLFVEVANKNRQAVYIGTMPFQPGLGSATYQNIVLSAGEKPLGDPPANVRDTAFPAATKKKSQ
jgi:hypothetical protein